MLIPLNTLVQKYGIKFQGILHVGAHECEEINDYERYVSRDKILWVEALPEKVEFSKNKFPNLLIENAVVSDKIETVNFNISNNGQSSSILEFGLHSKYHPHIHYVRSFECETKLLKDIIPKYNIHFNFVSLDIQGAELKALKGMEEYLSMVDYLYTEVNSNQVYQGCVVISELDNYLKNFGLERVETKMTPFEWGDALYIRV